MARLTLAHSPAQSVPRRFLLTMALWGMLAGALLMLDGDTLLRSRWTPGTLALVHAFTLGVLGNAMFGSVLQFLPVAACVRVRGSAMIASLLHGLLNFGALALVTGLHQGWPAAMFVAALLLPSAFALLASMTLPGLLEGAGQRLLRAGFGVAIGFALLTALLGGGLALAFAGRLVLPVVQLTDVHAAFGVLGWVIVLLATVARVVMPMFQGTGSVPATVQATWLCSALLTLPAAAWWYVASGNGAWLGGVVAVHALLFAGSALWLQWRAPRLRRGVLTWSWSIGLLALALATVALLAGVRSGVLAAVLALGIALPLLVLGMAQEIIAFIGWVHLRRQCDAMQIPGVQRLLPERDRIRVVLAQLPLWLLLPAAAWWPSAWLARAAGLASLLAWLAVWLAFRGTRRRALRFLQRVAARRGDAANA